MSNDKPRTWTIERGGRGYGEEHIKPMLPFNTEPIKVVEATHVEALEKEIAELKNMLSPAGKEEFLLLERCEKLKTENAQLKAELADAEAAASWSADEHILAQKNLTEARAEIERLKTAGRFIIDEHKNTDNFHAEAIETMLKTNEKLEAELLITNQNSSSLVDELAKAKSHELTTAVFAVDEKLREELAAAKSEIERLTRLDYSKEDARRNDELEKLKVDMLEAQGYIETQDLKINSLSREVEVMRVSNEILKKELREYEHETETIKELKEQIANQAKTIDQCKPESVVALKTENQILKDAFQTASTNYPKIIDELKAENEKLKEHFDNCNADKIVTLVLERDAAIAAKKKAWEGNKQYEILVDSERAEKNAALAKAQAMEQALEQYRDQHDSVCELGYDGNECTCGAPDLAVSTLAKWRGKENE